MEEYQTEYQTITICEECKCNESIATCSCKCHKPEQKGIDYSKDNVFDAIGRPDLKPPQSESENANDVLTKVRKILQTPEMADVVEHAWSIMQEVDLHRGDPNIQKIIDKENKKQSESWEEGLRKIWIKHYEENPDDHLLGQSAHKLREGVNNLLSHYKATLIKEVEDILDWTTEPKSVYGKLEKLLAKIK